MHRDLRLAAAETLSNLGIKKVFAVNDYVDSSGESMTPETSERLKELVKKLT